MQIMNRKVGLVSVGLNPKPLKTYFIVFQVCKWGVIVDDEDRCLKLKAHTIAEANKKIKEMCILKCYHVSYKIYETGGDYHKEVISKADYEKDHN